jgi:hypothetical protein
VNRILRILALIGFLSCILSLVLTFLLLSVGMFRSYESELLARTVILVAARLCATSTFAAVVAAIVVSLQRGQRGWAGVLIGAVFLIPFFEYVLSVYLTSRAAPISSDMLIEVLLGVPSWIQAETFIPLGLVALAALLPLVYSFTRRPEMSSITPVPERLGMSLPLNGIGRALALTGLVIFGVFLALWLSPVWQDAYRNPETVAGGQAIAKAVTLRVRDAGTALALAAAVIAAVAAVQRRQRLWAGVLVGALILVAFEPIFSAQITRLFPRSPLNSYYSPYGIPLVAVFVTLSAMLFVQIIVPAVPALVYSFIRAPAVSIAVSPPQQ